MILVPVKPNGPSLVRLIKSLTKHTTPPPRSAADQIHAYIAKSGHKPNPFVSTALLTLYAALGSLTSARYLFDEMPQPTLVSFTSMARAYATANLPKESLQLIRSAVSVAGFSLDPVALAIALSSCRQLGSLSAAAAIHGFIVKAGYEIDPFVSTELIGVYGGSGELLLAHKLFDEIPIRSVVVWNALVQQYIKHGFLVEAGGLFVKIPESDVISWNTMVTGFCRAGKFREALAWFHEMELSLVRPNELTMCMILSACAGLGALDIGIWVHAYIERNGMNRNGNLDHCLIDMYSKCGNIEKAVQVFEKIPVRRDLYSWTSVICGLAMHGRADDALGLFSRMQEVGVRPDDVTLVGVLSACAHGGLVDQGYHYFRSMKDLCGLSPKIEHYGCMVDLLGRAGCLQEAWLLIKEMPMEPNAVVWGSLLSACKVHNNAELGEIVATKLVELDPSDHWARVMMSNMYAEDCNWSGVTRVRKEMKGGGLRKIPGCSSIEVNGEVHEFVAGGNRHPEDAEICNTLAKIEAKMQKYDFQFTDERILTSHWLQNMKALSSKISLEHESYRTKGPDVLMTNQTE